TVNSIKQVFFNIPYKDVDNYEIIKEDQSFMGWYNFQIWHLEEVENDEKKETDSNDDIDDEDEKIELKKRLTRKQKKALRNS
ncbi:MAG: hypothetical protein OIF32_12885, partial [Campylobacterales bacterium]|nr:hypothetical protein [Campylobacterales bacterium]